MMKLKMNKSWLAQLIAIVAYVQHLVTPEHVSVIQDQTYNLQEAQVAFDPISFIIQVVIMMALSMAIGALTAKKPPKSRHAQPTGLGQFTVPTAEEGRSVQVLFGKRYITGPNVVWYGDLKSVAVQVRM